MPRRSRRPSERGPGGPIGGMRKGGSAELFEPPLRGEPRHRWVPALFAGAQHASGVGGTRPPRLSPEGGNGKGGDQTSLLPQAVRAGLAQMAGTPLVECVLALPRFCPLLSPKPICRSARSAFQKSCRRHPLLCRASIRTLNGPRWARCKLGSDSQAQVHHHSDGPGLLGAAISPAISEGSER